MKWTQIPAGDLHAAEQRVRVALGNKADSVVNLINTQPEFVELIVRQILDSVHVVGTINSKLLALLTTIKTVAVSEFIAADHFRVGETVDGVKISRSMGDNFGRYFLPKIEKNTAEAEIRVYRLLTNSRDIPIITELGGEDIAKTTLAHLWQTLKLQGDGQEGTLFTNGWANIFYIHDINGTLWAVYACWCGGGWRLGADSIEDPPSWDAGSLVYSR